MRRTLKWLGIALCVIIVTLAIFAAYVKLGERPNYNESIPIESRAVIPADSTTVAHGKALVIQVCAGCHRGGEQSALAGRAFDDVVANSTFGDVYIPNITQHPTHGIGQYSAGELYRLLRTGVKRNGDLSLPVMPIWPNMAESDVDAIIAFLKSDAPEVQAVDKPNEAYEPSFLAAALFKLALQPLPPQSDYPADPPPMEDLVTYGEYLTNDAYGCYHCHSGGLDVWNLMEPTETPGYLGGGTVFYFPHHEVTAPRILMDSLAEINNWTENEFIAAIKHNERTGKPGFREPMHPYPYLDSTEVSAIYRYLQSVTPAK